MLSPNFTVDFVENKKFKALRSCLVPALQHRVALLLSLSIAVTTKGLGLSIPIRGWQSAKQQQMKTVSPGVHSGTPAIRATE